MLGESIFGLLENAVEIVLGQALQFDADGEAALQLRNQVAGLADVEGPGGNEQNMVGVDDAALERLAEIASEVNAEVENIGARRLHTVMSRLLNDILYDVPDKIGANARILITAALVNERLTDMVKNRDLSQYIL